MSCHQGDEVQGTHLNQSAGKYAYDAEQIHGSGQAGCQYGMDYEENRRHKQEGELNRLRNTADNGCQHDGNEKSFELLLLLRLCGGVEGKGDTRTSEELGKACCGKCGLGT